MILPTRTVDKVWGRELLPAPFTSIPDTKIGEIWFEPPPELPELLVKYIFTSEKLSIQCHPSDDQAEASGKGRQGKEECWLVVDAEPGATLGIGFHEPVDADTMRAAALDGSIEDMLVWHEVGPGDFFYIPANTVHAIGPGVSIIEIQQNSDITYRLYDYGRPRELHLEQGMAVAKGEYYPDELHRILAANGHQSLVDGPFFRLDLVDGIPDEKLLYSYSGRLLVIPMKGEVLVAGEVVRPGQCALAPDLASTTFAPDGKALVTAPL
ncbi:class I mannose-6-phosphate isomerase [Alteraurantiacibacter aquimixticola]|uniref:Mannose-6-phosphate isomerase n=1 Tax=Alteraurantiacibacter aquimixticola TaxID=2489173 RepID=A0A4T3F7N4_9SPHN|nr:class I mannose-6-phosphate isomerase [Alteraurantiacibacter aquimixticola]TIX51000.1 mannose-6-phosphate isomerase [Alteraurantiacibacter aquimixticola]